MERHLVCKNMGIEKNMVMILRSEEKGWDYNKENGCGELVLDTVAFKGIVS